MESNGKNHLHKNKVHRILAHSYLTFFVFFLIGVCLDLFFGLSFFGNSTLSYWGLLLIILATILIFWAQNTSRNLDKENISKETFCKGPYCYTRSPTHWGLFFLMLGFGMVANAFFVILLTIIPFVASKFIFLDKEEEILEEKYGDSYREYKQMVKF